EELTLEVRKVSGEEWELETEKAYDELLGVEFDHPTLDRVRLCHNKCVFCFVDQIPGNMRKTLNMRDDDYRLSFLHGNFVTLTNVKPGELERIATLKMSPINISVHATNPELRVRLLGNKKSGEILDQIRYLAEHDIEMNTQIVLCPEWNDGAELDRTIADLSPFFPAVRTLSVVPVGLTKHRQGLSELRACTREEARRVIDQIASWQDRLRPTIGANFVHAADEFYVLAGSDIPAARYYDEFAQIENGVGLLRTFKDDFDRLAGGIPKRLANARHVAIVTGTSASETIMQAVLRLQEVEGLVIDVHRIQNVFYGEQVTVTGLITGQDIVSQVKEAIRADVLLLPDVMLKDDSDVFLDDYTVQQVEEELGRPILIVPPTASGLLYGALGRIQDLPVRRRYEATFEPVAQ
ncbi:MAG: DUF512 domain-containing protein, partial [Firmicutes bacterium]|nr:DUF512 domain-containing protein [Bacillota bacterium]